MKKIFKILAVLAAFIMCMALLVSCSSSEPSQTVSSSTEDRAAAREARKKKREETRNKEESTDNDTKEKTDEKSDEEEKSDENPEEEKSDTADDAEMVLVYSENQVDGYPTVLGAYEFKRIVEKDTDGRIQVDVKINSEVGSEDAVCNMIQNDEEFEGNRIGFVRVSLAPLISATNYNKLNVLQLPFLYRDKEHMRAVLNSDIGEVFLNELAEDNTGLRGLAWFDSGARNFYNSQHEIKSPSDLEGLTIRVMNSDLMKRLVELLGGNPVSTSYEEVPGALERGEIDGAENNWPSYVSQQHYKYAPYLSTDAHTRMPEMIVMNDKIWNELSESDQDIIKRAAQLGAEVEWEEWAKQEEEYEKQAKAEGCIVTEISDNSEFQKAVESIYDEFGSDYKDVIKEIQEYE